MDPTWEETIAPPALSDRAPASADTKGAPPPSWDDTQDVKAAPQDAPSWDETSDLQQYGTPGQQAIAGAEGAGRGVLGPIFTGAERIAGVSPEGMRLREEANPWTAGLAEAGSFGVTAALTGGMSAGARAALEAGEITSKAAQGTSLLAKAAKNFTIPGIVGKVGEAATGAVGLGKATGAAKLLSTPVKLGSELMALQGGSELTKAIQQDPGQTVPLAITNIGLSGLIGGVAGVPLGAVSGAWDKLSGPGVQKILTKIKADWGMGNPLEREEEIISPALKQFLNIFGGVPKETMEEYAARRDLVMSAPEFHEVYGQTLDHLLEMQENLETKKASLGAAKANFKEFLNQQKLALKQAGYDANSADTLAQQALKEAQTRMGIGLQEGALDAAPKAFSAVQKLRKQAMDLSQGARDILDNTPGSLSLKPIFEAIRPMQDELYAKGFPHMAEDLGKTMDIFAHQYGDKISYPDAKSMIQGLQQRGTWNLLANEVAQGTRRYYNQLSGIMNEALKDAVPAYRSAMEPTAEAFDLLGKLDKYASPEAANKAALGLKSVANYANEMPLLKQLEEKAGIPFTTQLEQYANPAVREAMIKTMPEYSQALKIADGLQRLKDPEVKAALERAPYLSQSYRELTKAEKALQAAIDRKTNLSGITPNTLEGKMKSVMAGKGMNTRRAFEHIPGMDDMTIPEILDLINIRQAFEKGAMNGSRNVNLLAKMGGTLGAFVGGLAGATVGHPIGGAGLGGSLGTGAGALYGGILDKEGPAMVKNIIDKYLDRYGDLPKAVGSNADTIRAALLHFLGMDSGPDSKAFKSMANYLDFVKGGSRFLGNAAGAIFQGGKTVPNHIWSNQEKIKKLDEKTKGLQGNEQGMLDIGGNLGHYMPDHGAALSKTAATAINYINQNRPQAQKNAPLDDEMEPSKESVYAFNRGLQIAQQPLTVFQHIKDNTLLPEDVQHLQAMYPEYYQHMKQKVADAMATHISKGEKVPYPLRQSLSLFLGENLDSSLAPQNILAAQNVFRAQRLAQPPPQAPARKSSTKKLGEEAVQYKTAEQSAQARRSRQT